MSIDGEVVFELFKGHLAEDWTKVGPEAMTKVNKITDTIQYLQDKHIPLLAHTDRQIYRQTDIHSYIWTNTETDTQTHRLTDR